MKKICQCTRIFLDTPNACVFTSSVAVFAFYFLLSPFRNSLWFALLGLILYEFFLAYVIHTSGDKWTPSRRIPFLAIALTAIFLGKCLPCHQNVQGGFWTAFVAFLVLLLLDWSDYSIASQWVLGISVLLSAFYFGYRTF